MEVIRCESLFLTQVLPLQRPLAITYFKMPSSLVLSVPKPRPPRASFNTPVAAPTWPFQSPTGMSYLVAGALSTVCCSLSYKHSLTALGSSIWGAYTKRKVKIAFLMISLRRRILSDMHWTSTTLSAQIFTNSVPPPRPDSCAETKDLNLQSLPLKMRTWLGAR